MIELLITYNNIIKSKPTIIVIPIPSMSKPLRKLSDEQITQMQKLEQLFHNRYLTAEFLHQLVAIYVKAIECFGEDWRFMRSYFMEKMQFVLTCPEILQVLEGGGSMVDSIRETVRITERPFPNQPSANHTSNGTKPNSKQPENFSQSLPPQQSQARQPDRFANIQQTQIKHTHEQHHYYHYDQNKNNQRGMKIDHKMKVMREVEENMKNIHKEVSEADKKLDMVEEKVKHIAKDQENQFNERLAQRKRKLRKKSVEIKAKVVEVEGREPEPEPPVIKKEELKQAQRELTRAIFNFTVRMTEKQRQKQSNDLKKSIKGRVKKAKDIDQDEQLLEQKEQEDQPVPVITMKKKSTRQNQELKKQLIEVQKQNQGQVQGRVKTIRRHLDSDEDQNDMF